jgi:hypothetical protein
VCGLFEWKQTIKVFIQTGYDKIGANGADKNTRLVLILFS